MHNSLNRLQSVFGFFTSCAFALAASIAFIAIIPIPASQGSPSASISARNVQVVKGRPHYYSTKREEYAQIKFDLDADLSSLFTWNTKQIFVYVTVNYPGKSGSKWESEAVIWDMIVPATSTPYSWQNLKPKYFAEKPKSKSKAKSRRNSDTSASTKDVVKPGVISLKNQKPKYQITDPTGVLSQRSNATLQVSWNVQPWVGALVWDKGYLGGRVGQWQPGKEGRSLPFDFPPLKGPKAEAVREKDGPKTPEAGKAAPATEV